MIPCKECLLLPTCRHKRYLDLFFDCSLIAERIRRPDWPALRDSKAIYELESLFKPTNWRFGHRFDDNNEPLVDEKGEQY